MPYVCKSWDEFYYLISKYPCKYLANGLTVQRKYLTQVDLNQILKEKYNE